MTRINLVPPSELSRQHLIAEYKELPRIFSLVRVAAIRGEKPEDMPQKFTLGTGHVRFFYPRLRWLCRRFRSLVCEMNERGYNPQHITTLTDAIPDEWLGDYEPTPEDIALSRARLVERDPHFYKMEGVGDG